MPKGRKVNNKVSHRRSNVSRKNRQDGHRSRLQKLAGPLLFGSILLIIIVGAVYKVSCEPGFRKVQQVPELFLSFE